MALRNKGISTGASVPLDGPHDQSLSGLPEGSPRARRSPPRDGLPAAEEQWLAPEMRREEIEGLGSSDLKLPRFRGVELDLGDYGSVVTASIAAS